MTENKSHQKYTFSKEERLCSEKAIEQLFSKGSSFIAYPLRVVYLVKEEENLGNCLPQVLISVPKRKFKRANKRNRIKRLVREAYRLHKHPFFELCREKNSSMSIAFLYLKDELPTYLEIEKAVLKTLVNLKDRMTEENEKTAD